MIRFIPSGLVLLTMLGLLPGCASDSIEDLTGKPIAVGCDTTALAPATYTAVIKPIISTNCLRCHSPGGAGAMGSGNRVVLDTHEGVKTIALANVGRENSWLISVVNHEPDADWMPKDIRPAKIPACDIVQIRRWVKRGALND